MSHEDVVNVSMYRPALLSLSLGYNFDNFALKPPTKIKQVADYSYLKAHLRGFRKRTQTALDFVLVICKDISRTILLFTVISVTVHSFNLQISIFLVSGQYSL